MDVWFKIRHVISCPFLFNEGVLNKKMRSTDAVISELEQLILSGAFAYGEKLPAERTLMERFNVGRNVVREAISALSRNGLLETKPRHRPIVAYSGQDTALDSLTVFVQHFLDGEGGYEQLFNSRIFIEAALCRHAALHARKEDIQNLREALRNNKEAIDDADLFYQTDVLFHKVLYEIPRNPVFTILQKIYVSWLAKYWSRIKRDPELNMMNYKRHEAILEAIVDRDPDEAERAMHNHLNNSWGLAKDALKD